MPIVYTGSGEFPSQAPEPQGSLGVSPFVKSDLSTTPFTRDTPAYQEPSRIRRSLALTPNARPAYQEPFNAQSLVTMAQPGEQPQEQNPGIASSSASKQEGLTHLAVSNSPAVKGQEIASLSVNEVITNNILSAYQKLTSGYSGLDPNFIPTYKIKQILVVKRRERGPGAYIYDRSSQEYLLDFQGIGYALEYARQLGSSITVLDIGGGTTRAIAGLAESKLGKGLHFEATGLIKHPKIASNIGDENFHETPAELMRGIEDNSIALAIGDWSVTYSAYPEIVMHMIDRKLVAGGVFKTVVCPEHETKLFGDLPVQPAYKFTRVLSQLGYSYYVHRGGGQDILIGIKPGGNLAVTAEELFDLDAQTLTRQLHILHHNEELLSANGCFFAKALGSLTYMSDITITNPKSLADMGIEKQV